MTRRFCALFIGIVAMVGISAVGHADQKLYNGTECVANGNNPGALSYSTGWVFNTNSGGKTVDCPVVMDTYTMLSTHNWIYLWDRNPNVDFSCELRSQSAVSSSMYYDSVYTSGVSSSPTKHSFSAIGYYTDGSRYISCRVPGVYDNKRSGITAYSVNEG